MARIVLVGIARSLSLVTIGAAVGAATAGCGGSAEVTYDAGPDSAPFVDVCAPYSLEPAGDDPCVLALPPDSVPARAFYDVDDDTVILVLVPTAELCDGADLGFYTADPDDPTTVTLCPAACEALPDPLPEIQGTACGI